MKKVLQSLCALLFVSVLLLKFMGCSLSDFKINQSISSQAIEKDGVTKVKISEKRDEQSSVTGGVTMEGGDSSSRNGSKPGAIKGGANIGASHSDKGQTTIEAEFDIGTVKGKAASNVLTDFVDNGLIPKDGGKVEALAREIVESILETGDSKSLSEVTLDPNQVELLKQVFLVQNLIDEMADAETSIEDQHLGSFEDAQSTWNDFAVTLIAVMTDTIHEGPEACTTSLPYYKSQVKICKKEQNYIFRDFELNEISR